MLNQIPSPGSRMLRFQGDFVTFELRSPVKGNAYLRTNLGHAKWSRREIIEDIENSVSRLGRDWFDFPMVEKAPGRFVLTLPLLENGHFQAKAFVVDSETKVTHWPEGKNVIVNVEADPYRFGNSIYCAFIRQFGPHKKAKRTWSQPSSEGDGDQGHGVEFRGSSESKASELEKEGFSVIPPSGTFRDLIKELDHIFGALNCKILHLLPIHPVPTVYGRMGRFGSPYAALDFFGVDPALAEFDTSSTPLDQFSELVDAVHARAGKLILDIALNHTGWAAKLHELHPEWIRRNADGSFHQPGAWGITWADLTELEHTNEDLWGYLADVLLVWCDRGVDGFRCDAGYMIPIRAWEYLVAKVREKYPETVFLLEGLGGDPRITEDLLNRANLNWAYSELFQNYSRAQITSYMETASHLSQGCGLMVHYAETHDNNRLASVSQNYARMRVGLSAWLSFNGSFGFSNGVEWFAEEKINVHRDSGLNWGQIPNQVEWIGAINKLLQTHPCFSETSQMKLLGSENEDLLLVHRQTPSAKLALWIAVNLSSQDAIVVKSNPEWTRQLLSRFDGAGKIMDSGDLEIPPLGFAVFEMGSEETKPRYYQFQYMALQALEGFLDLVSIGQMNPVEIAQAFYHNPVQFCQRHGRVCLWDLKHDLRRDFVLPQEHALILKGKGRFQAWFMGRRRNSRQFLDGSHYVVFPPPREDELTRALPQPGFQKLRIIDFKDKVPRRLNSRIWLAIAGKDLSTGMLQTDPRNNLFLGTNGRGSMLRASVSWARLESRYDALFAVNLHPDVPEDRHIFLRRWRGWTRFLGNSTELDISTTRFVWVNDAISFQFSLPVGTGKTVLIQVQMKLIEGENTLVTHVFREKKIQQDMLGDEHPVTLIFRPDIEDRNFHHLTKAFTGPETTFNNRTIPKPRGFEFNSSRGVTFKVISNSGHFVSQPQWTYNLLYPFESTRGLEDRGDLFSPGYLEFQLKGGEVNRILTTSEEKMGVAEDFVPVCVDQDTCNLIAEKPFRLLAPDMPMDGYLQKAVKQFVARRGENKTVIAGFPWFLDWGRDTLICARGLITAGLIEEVEKILIQFGRFEKDGTLPNMIHGTDASNRDTSDAPLWFFVVCRDLGQAAGSWDFLKRKVDSTRSLFDVLIEIAEGYIKGTPNGIWVDPETGLVFSPSHFTWMDTNFPAGTPREGFPVEIQALWYHALDFLYLISQKEKWKELAEKVRASVLAHFWMERKQYLADCLHLEREDKARMKVKDAQQGDALRPNQVLAVLFGLLDGSKAQLVVESLEKLVVPGALRSLADQPVEVSLPIFNNQSKIINDPKNPFWPRYEGDEDSRRKPAYHNGTAWVWLFPMFCEAVDLVRPGTGLDYLSTLEKDFYSGCIGQLPEILDGQTPHTPRGCDAQAWSVTEFLRVYRLLHDKHGLATN